MPFNNKRNAILLVFYWIEACKALQILAGMLVLRIKDTMHGETIQAAAFMRLPKGHSQYFVLKGTCAYKRFWLIKTPLLQRPLMNISRMVYK